MNFETYFKASSYAMIAVAMMALMLAGGLQLGLGVAFAVVMAVAWKWEGTRWQLSERVGLVIVLLAIPLFLLDLQYQHMIGEPRERIGVSALAHLIVFLSAVKLLQTKSDRDWVFLYLISFFELLLAAGLSFSPVFLATLALYLPCAISTVIALEIRKARRGVSLVETRLLVPPGQRVFWKLVGVRTRKNVAVKQLPLVACSLIGLIVIFAVPLFLIAPRAGSAAITRGGSGLSNFVGFSETVSLGALGELKRNNEIVMHVRLDDAETGPKHDLRWRGIALDEFTGSSWKKSAAARHTEQKPGERGFFQLGTTEALHRVTTQTVFLEPMDSSVLFAAPRALAVQGDLPYLRVDGEGSMQIRPHDFDRIIYKAFSDVTEPVPETLRQDVVPYPASYDRYKQLPESLDPRIAEYARRLVIDDHARNRYDTAKAIESHLQQDFGYSLQMKATGPDPLADFLFRVKAGHCEYFSTAMTVMLRTQGVAARVVNGFLPGEYNGAADAFTVRQSDAHSWVEVYFPETNAWVTFDPTPAAGKLEPTSTGLTAQVGKYAEAFELLWFQYVVGYDRQEQRTLATSLHSQVSQYQRLFGNAISGLQSFLRRNYRRPLLGASAVLVLGMAVVIGLRIKGHGWGGFGKARRERDSERSAVEFYARLMRLLEERGLKRAPDQTPLEFAGEISLREAAIITEAYNRVRFGKQKLSSREVAEIETMLLKFDQERVQ